MEKLLSLNEKIITTMEVKYFVCYINEQVQERINEGLRQRNIDADSVISITDNSDYITVWYKEKVQKIVNE
jgi:hypothetical protein